MASFSQLDSGKWRVQVRRAGFYRGATFNLKRDAEAWAREVERQADHASTGGFVPIPKGTRVDELIDSYVKAHTESPKNSKPTGARLREFGKTKTATLKMLKREIGKVHLASLSAVTLRDFIDRRRASGAGGVTIAADLSFLSAVLKWARHAQRLDVAERLALEARESLKHHGIDTRGHERNREPTDAELDRLYAHWRAKTRQRIDVETICRFALATAMRLGEICRLQIEDIDREAKTVVIRDRKDPRNKAGNDQIVPLLPAAWVIVEPLIAVRSEGPLFPAKADSVSTAFTRACAELDPPILDLHFHDLRHRAAAELFRMGLDIPRVALMTGHKTWTMLRRYTDIKPADVHAVLAAKAVRR